jgi:N-acetyl-anhydromuramyl-L-alanine amidase AmpD
MGGVGAIVVHHTATDRAATVEDIRRMHVEGRGWRDIGYHWLVSQPTDEHLATVHQGRMEDGNGRWESWEYGAHVRGHNHRSVGVSLIGNYDTDALPRAMESVLCLKLARLCQQFGLREGHVVGHRDLAATACPGRHVDMDAIQRRVGRYLRMGDL